MRVQGETLDNLAEGVAVFGPDGRIRLSNPAFNALWGLSRRHRRAERRISRRSATQCDPLADGQPVARASSPPSPASTRNAATATARPNSKNGTVLRYAVIHLPNGQVMMTFVDVTDSVNVERALKEKNEALQKADQLKNDFVQHVSYELRSPLTNIIGFTELLSLPTTGPLEPRQREYVEHIGSSSSVLLTIVNDILDLATVDAGIMELDIAEVQRRAAPSRPPPNWSPTGCDEHSITLKIDAGARAEELPWRRDPRPPDPLQSAEQRRELRAGRQHDHAGLPAARATASNSPSMTTVPACRRKCSTRCSAASSRAPMAAAGAAPASACRSSRASSNCMAAASASRPAKDQGTTVICLFPAVPVGHPRRGGMSARR